MRFSLLLPFCLSLCHIAPAWALQSDAQLAERQRYDDCLLRAVDAPEEALEDALSWRNEGGGWPAQHCHARSLSTLGDRTGAALQLENLVAEQRAGMVEQERLSIWLEAGDLRLASQDFTHAAEAFQAALALDASHPDAVFGRARARAGQEDWQGAFSDARFLTELDQGHLPAWRLRAEAALETLDLDAASEAVITALTLEPTDLNSLVLRGRINEAHRLAEG